MFHVERQGEIDYSSIFPCPAALTRQLIQQQLAADFGDQPLSYTAVRAWLGSTQDQPATAHSPRNRATLQVRLDAQTVALPLLKLIKRTERVLGTAVQTAVKRADEQLFALASSGPASTYLGMFKDNLDTLLAAWRPNSQPAPPSPLVGADLSAISRQTNRTHEKRPAQWPA
jgi:hypothetical protein